MTEPHSRLWSRILPHLRDLVQEGLDEEQVATMLAAAVNSSRMPMVVTDPRQPDAPVVLANPAFLTLTGYAATEVLGYNCRFLQGPGTDPAAVAEIRNAVRAEREIEIELLNYTRDGTPFPNRLSITPVRDPDGALAYFVASLLDLRAERTAGTLAAQKEERLRLVAAEMNHRMNNTLATVQAIVRQTLRRAGMPAAIGDVIGGRLVALRDAHALLTQRDWQHSDLHEVILSAVQPHRDNTGRFHLAGPPVELEPTASLAMAMAIHELCTNAVKYGALSVPGGSIDIKWEIAHSPGERRLDLCWQERGGPAVRAPEHKGFGSMLIKDALSADLRGRVELEYAVEGVICRIRADLQSTASEECAEAVQGGS